MREGERRRREGGGEGGKKEREREGGRDILLNILYCWFEDGGRVHGLRRRNKVLLTLDFKSEKN